MLLRDETTIDAIEQSKTMTRTSAIISILILACVALAGCGRSETPSATAAGSPAATKAATPATQFERDLQEVRNSSFQHVWLISRRDGKVIDKDDAAFLRTNAPQVIDWVKTDGGTKVFAGTNFDLELAGLNLIRKRFVVEDYTGR